MASRSVVDRSAVHGLKSRLYAVLGLTTAFLIAEIIGGLATGSLALLADAGHVVCDIFGVGASLVAATLSERPANARKTYGYLRGEILAAILNGALMIVVALGILFEAYRRFQHPPQVSAAGMMAIAACGMAVNLLAALLLHGKAGENINARGAYLEVLSDLVGSASALVAAVAIKLSGWTLADPIASVAIGIFILPRAWKLTSESVDVLLESTPEGTDLPALRHELERLPGVTAVHDLHAWAITSGRNALSAHLVVEDACDSGAILTRAQRLLRDRFRFEHATLQIEPIDFDLTFEGDRHA